MVKELGLPREALVNLIVRGGEALPPRGSTEIEAGDELHIVARLEAARARSSALAERWRNGPLGEPAVPVAAAARGAPQVFSVRPLARRGRRPGLPRSDRGRGRSPSRLRVRRDGSGALVVLADGRYAATGADAARRRRPPPARRVVRAPGRPRRAQPAERAWWQELAGALASTRPARHRHRLRR